jgi:DNA-binding IclR family transcriptional regulator
MQTAPTVRARMAPEPSDTSAPSPRQDTAPTTITSGSTPLIPRSTERRHGRNSSAPTGPTSSNRTAWSAPSNTSHPSPFKRLNPHHANGFQNRRPIKWDSERLTDRTKLGPTTPLRNDQQKDPQLSPKPRTPGVDSARKVLQILLQFNGERHELTTEELASAVSSSVSSTYRYISLLRELNLIGERSKGAYVLTPVMLGLARSAEKSLDIVDAAHPVLYQLSKTTGEAALLVKKMGDSAVCIDRSDTDHPVRLTFNPGQVLLLHRGAAPKVLLANMVETKRIEYLNGIGEMLTTFERRKLESELEKIRKEGWAESAAEVDTGVWAVAAPIRVSETVIAAVCVAAPEYRIDSSKREFAIKMVQNAAKEIGEHIVSP